MLWLASLPPLPERIYNPITAMGFSAMFTFQLRGCRHPIAVLGVVDTFGQCHSGRLELASGIPDTSCLSTPSCVVMWLDRLRSRFTEGVPDDQCHSLNYSGENKGLSIFDHCSPGFILVLMLNMKLKYKTDTINDI